MRDVVVGLILVFGVLWVLAVLAVLYRLIAGPVGLTKRQSFLGRLARFCRAVALLSP